MLPTNGSQNCTWLSHSRVPSSVSGPRRLMSPDCMLLMYHTPLGVSLPRLGWPVVMGALQRSSPLS